MAELSGKMVKVPYSIEFPTHNPGVQYLEIPYEDWLFTRPEDREDDVNERVQTLFFNDCNYGFDLDGVIMPDPEPTLADEIAPEPHAPGERE